MRSRILVIASLAVINPLAMAQEQTNKFLVRVNGATQRTEEYTIARSAAGYKLKSKARWQQARQVLEQDQLLEPDLTLKRYTLMAADANGIQTIEAAREKDKVRMTVRLPNKEPQTFKVPWAPRMVVLDNMVVSHFQVLLDSFAGKPPAPDWGFLVPQQLALLPGSVTLLPREQPATLNGQALTVRKYSVNAGGLIMEFWADPATARLMRVWVPTQRVEFIREGFVLPGVPAPTT
jgi:hypothetical protein